MSKFWKNREAAASNLRLWDPTDGWKGYAGLLDEEGRVIEGSASRWAIDSAFLNALGSANLMVLTGAGSSFCTVDRTFGFSLAPGMNDLWEAVEKAVGVELFSEVRSLLPSLGESKNIEKLLSLCKIYVELHEGIDSPEGRKVASFVKLAEQRILRTVDFVDGDTSLEFHESLLRKIARRGVRKSRAKIFTTNYDMCFEEASKRQRTTAIDGFSHSLDQVYDRSYFDIDIVRRVPNGDAPDYIENVIHIYKLHGSVDWRRRGSDVVRSRSKDLEPVLIYPRSSKYQESFEAPFLDMMAAFQAALREPETALIIAGFGFNDDHISRPILSALEANMSLRLIMCDVCFVPEELLENSPQPIGDAPLSGNKAIAQIQRLAAGGDQRIHLLNGRFEDMALAIPDLVGETDRERHLDRVRSLREVGA